MSADLTVADVLEKAANKLAYEGAWTQGAFARDRRGNAVRMESDQAVCFCGAGAVYMATRSPLTALRCLDFLGAFVRAGKFAEWNDAEGRTQAEVVAKLREAAAKARAS